MLNKLFSIKSQKGVTMIEYALITSMVATVAINALDALGGNLQHTFDAITIVLGAH